MNAEMISSLIRCFERHQAMLEAAGMRVIPQGRRRMECGSREARDHKTCEQRKRQGSPPPSPVHTPTITPEGAKLCREMHADGFSHTDIARKLNVSLTTIWRFFNCGYIPEPAKPGRKKGVTTNR